MSSETSAGMASRLRPKRSLGVHAVRRVKVQRRSADARRAVLVTGWPPRPPAEGRRQPNVSTSRRSDAGKSPRARRSSGSCRSRSDGAAPIHALTLLTFRLPMAGASAVARRCRVAQADARSRAPRRGHAAPEYGRRGNSASTARAPANRHVRPPAGGHQPTDRNCMLPSRIVRGAVVVCDASARRRFFLAPEVGELAAATRQNASGKRELDGRRSNAPRSSSMRVHVA